MVERDELTSLFEIENFDTIALDIHLVSLEELFKA